MLFSFPHKILPLIFLKLNKFKLNRRLGVVYEFKKLKFERFIGAGEGIRILDSLIFSQVIKQILGKVY